MIPYLFHASILLSGSFLFYWLLIKNETFFALNRWLLIGSIVLSLLIPLITIPEEWSLKTAAVSEEVVPTINETDISEQSELSPIVSNELHQVNNVVKATAATPTTTQIHPTAEASVLSNNNIFTTKLPTLLWYGYLVGAVVFLLAFLVQLLILVTKMYSLISYKDGRFRIVELVKDEAPYSFWNSIFINPTKYDLETYTQIIDHEKIHIQQAHFIDKLIAEFLLIAFWFNPFVWLLRNAITNNLEYLTDSSMLKKGTAKQSYQMSLLKVSVPQHPLNLSTNYNNSFLKNRIAMMNAKKSSAQSSWKYLFLLPLFGFSVVYLNAVDSNNDITILDTVEKPLLNLSTETDTIPEKKVTRTTSTSTTTLDDSKPGDSNIHVNTHIDKSAGTTTTTTYSNTASETITNGQSSFSTNRSIHIDGDNVSIRTTFRDGNWNNDLQPGHWEAELLSDKVCFQINNSNPAKNSTWITSECFKKGALSSIPMNSDKDFSIKRAAGEMKFNGSFSGNKGKGTFQFSPNNDFRNYLANNGMTIKKERDMLHLFLAEMDKEYIGNLTSAGFKPDGQDLIALSIHGVDKSSAKEYVKLLKDLDYKGNDVHDIVTLQIHGADPRYIQELRAAGLKNLSAEEIVQAKIHGVEPSFIKATQDYGFDLDIEEIVQFSIHGVDVDYISELENIGYPNLKHEDIIQAKIHGVDPYFIKEVHKAGIDNISMEELVQFSIHGIKADYVKGFKESGIKNITNEEIIQAGIHGVDVKFVKRLSALGINNLSMEDVVHCAIHGVNANEVNGYQKLNFKNLEVGDFVQAKIHGVNPSFIKNLQDLGFNDADMSDFINAKIHGVNSQFVKRAREKGHDPKSMEDCVNLKIRGI